MSGRATTAPETVDRRALSPVDAARYIGIADQVKDPHRTMLELHQRGTIAGVRVGRSVVFPIATLDGYLAGRRT